MFQKGSVDGVESRIVQKPGFAEMLHVLAAYIVHAVVVLPVAAAICLRKTPGNGGGPEDYEFLIYFVVVDLRGPAIHGLLFMLHHGDVLLFAPVHQVL